MPSTATDRIDGLTTSVAIKAPCRVATTANITLSGLQTIDDVTVAAGDRVLVKNQTAAAENGIWVAQSTAWSRARDFNGSRDAVQGTLVAIHSGTQYARTIWQVSTVNPIYIGTTEISFVVANDVALTQSLAASSGASMIGFLQSGASSVPRTLQSKGREIATPLDKGGDGDGVADDTAAIQAAIDEHEVISLVDSSRTYLVTDTITIPSGRTILGFGATVKRKTGSGQFDIFQNSDQVSGNTDIVILGLKVDGNATADSLTATEPTHRFSGISFKGVTGKSEITGCTVTGTINNETGAGIYIFDCEDVLVENNTLYGNDRTGIYYRNGARNKFVRNICYSNAGSGISGKDCNDSEFIGNQTYSNGSGGNYSGLNASCLRARVIGNLSYSNTGAGIVLGETGSADASDAIATANTCYSNTLEGIYVANSDRVKVIGNNTYSNVRNNIRVLGGADYCTVQGNTARNASGTGATGIYIDDGVGHKIIGNDVSGSYSSGIYIDPTATDGICTGNTSYNNCTGSSANAGITLDTTTGWTVTNNRCYDTAVSAGTQTSGILIVSGAGNALIGNDVRANKTNPILEVSTPSYSRRHNMTGIGVGQLQSSFTAVAGATHTINNDNSQATGRIKVWPLNAAAVAKPVYVSSVSVGVSFTITPSGGNFAGTETYAYEID